ncbi:hypothetical protein PGTUg99_023981 [Puccinia graminis f. sp. tritici]|uniref:Coenzyme Q-binding protein COQ10 START domain-containing protein n=2 Tax=Puccinia graminis f. sp. tritici TaxID=56615 RepID=E3KK89_PUCGT|nr:uncharacterized protein PGTG_10873 [Puccinia graminis f. sp. tritici CRL 75-36-700-3]EFP84714.1 hypothetical protein PGTG_10873 [Puccinia graminis f. sp. tritici CRL 75-36-700-3]KAA1088729.1 hypothetical protein PGTUg99_023981 [Puccinia graminis f. sp. tritici]
MFHSRALKLSSQIANNSPRKFSTSTIRTGSHQLLKNLPYERSKIYSVIVDVQSYPEFIPYCLSTRIIEPVTQLDQKKENHKEQDSQSTRSNLINHQFEVFTRIGYKGFETDYHSQVICEPFESVRVIAKPSSTFTNLTTTWTLSDPPCSSTSSTTTSNSKPVTQVGLDLSFKFKNPIHEYLLTDQAIWKKFSTLIIKSFEDRLASLN